MNENLKKAQVNLYPELQEKLRATAIKNKIKPTNQGLTDLAYQIATQVVENLDQSDLEQVTNLKFK